MPNKADIGCLVYDLQVSLFPNSLDCIFKDSILVFGMPSLNHMNHRNMMLFIHFEYINCFFSIIFNISQAYYEIQEIAAHIEIICCNYSIGHINHYKNLSFKNKALGYMNYFNIRYYVLTFY